MTGGNEVEVYLWILHSLFWVGVLLMLLGLALVIIPTKILDASQNLNRWISTKSFFDSINRPRYVERGFYRHHRLSGMIITLLSLICLYMLAFYDSPAEISQHLIRTMESEFGRWLAISAYYLLLACLALAVLIGLIVLIRPSLLKSLERWGNRWVDTDSRLEGFDRVYEIPSNILPGRPRLFGLFVLLGALYIVYSTASLVF